MKISYSSEKIDHLKAELKLAHDETQNCVKKSQGRLLLLCLILEMVNLIDVVHSSKQEDQLLTYYGRMTGCGCWLLVVGCWLLVVGCWLLVVGCWLLVVGCWLLVVGCWLLVVGCWLLVVGCWLLVVGCWLLDVGCWLLVVGCWLLVVGCWLLVVGCWLLVVGCWMLVGAGLSHKILHSPHRMDRGGWGGWNKHNVADDQCTI